MTPAWHADSFAIARTGSDGRWTATFNIHPRSAHDHDGKIRAAFTAPNRAAVEYEVHPYSAAERLGRDIVLQHASSLDLEPVCGGGPCRGKLSTSTTRYDHYDGTHVERLVPGTYTIHVRENGSQPGERLGTAIVDITHATKAQRVKVTLAASGTGKSIRGTAKLDAVARENIGVMARCTGGSIDVRREALTDAAGAFEIRDAGPPPCEVSLASGSGSNASATVTILPAAGIALEGAAIRAPPWP
jgi:hypothetical protein